VVVGLWRGVIVRGGSGPDPQQTAGLGLPPLTPPVRSQPAEAASRGAGEADA
jgi:hypothetical protein